MQLCETLERSGYALDLKTAGDLAIVEAHRTPEATISAKAAAPLLLQLSRCQDEAIAYMRLRSRAQATQTPKRIVNSPHAEVWTLPPGCKPEHAQRHANAILAGRLPELEEAICYCKYNIARGFVTTSDGRTWVDVLREYMGAK